MHRRLWFLRKIAEGVLLHRPLRKMRFVKQAALRHYRLQRARQRLGNRRAWRDQRLCTAKHSSRDGIVRGLPHELVDQLGCNGQMQRRAGVRLQSCLGIDARAGSGTWNRRRIPRGRCGRRTLVDTRGDRSAGGVQYGHAGCVPGYRIGFNTGEQRDGRRALQSITWGKRRAKRGNARCSLRTEPGVGPLERTKQDVESAYVDHRVAPDSLARAS